MSVTMSDFETLYEDLETKDMVSNTSLADFFYQLSNLRESSSQRAEDHKRERGRVRKKPALSNPGSEDNATQLELELDNPQYISSASHLEASSPAQILGTPIPPVTPQNKRIASDGSAVSYAISSTDTTPKKLDKPEQEVQSLQNTMVKLLIKIIWDREITIPWVQNRKMWLDYVT